MTPRAIFCHEDGDCRPNRLRPLRIRHWICVNRYPLEDDFSSGAVALVHRNLCDRVKGLEPPKNSSQSNIKNMTTLSKNQRRSLDPRQIFLARQNIPPKDRTGLVQMRRTIQRNEKLRSVFVGSVGGHRQNPFLIKLTATIPCTATRLIAD